MYDTMFVSNSRTATHHLPAGAGLADELKELRELPVGVPQLLSGTQQAFEVRSVECSLPFGDGAQPRRLLGRLRRERGRFGFRVRTHADALQPDYTTPCLFY